MSTLTREEAGNIIDGIKRQNGGIDEELRARVPEEFLEVLSNVRRQLASTTSTLAKDVYSKDSRFILELIQNAEDNSYINARAVNEEPYISFTLHSDRIVVDSNEDGFTEENVRAICSVAQSTKNVTAGYIGEKGIGFKSVFKVAQRVTIQSGPWAFSFNSGDPDGLGMVTPYNAAFEKIPATACTRTTLWLRDAGDFDARRKDFEVLPDTLLLFLSKLKILSIAIHDGSSITRTDYHFSYRPAECLGTLSKVISLGRKSKSEKFDYYITKRQVSDLPNHERREHTRRAEIVLAFPVNKDKKPKIEPQHVYAYLPMRQIGFNFLIQSDFITQANREDLLEAPWNDSLLDGVAEAFRDSVLQFCADHPLQYDWMFYIPDSNIHDPFWVKLQHKVHFLLRKEKIIQTRVEGPLITIEQARHLIPEVLDSDDQPLLPDLVRQVFPASSYSNKAITILITTGLTNVTATDMHDRIVADVYHTASRIKSKARSEDWHSRISRLISKIYKKEKFKDRIRSLDLIPCIFPEHTHWVCAKLGQIYWPHDGLVAIPNDLNLRLVDPSWITNVDRRQLYFEMGIESCDPHLVIRLMKDRYALKKRITMAQSLSHLHYLYQQDPSDTSDALKTIPVYDRQEIPVYRRRVTSGQDDMVVSDVYFESSGDYGITDIDTRLAALCDDEIDSNLHFLHADYTRDVPEHPDSINKKWQPWLEDMLGVQRVPRLLIQRSSGNRILPLGKQIIENMPERFVGFLKAHWSTYDDLIDERIQSIISDVRVLTTSGDSLPLQDTYLPLPELTAICESLHIQGDYHFVHLDMNLGSNIAQDWKFLSDKFGVGDNADLRFYLNVLEHVSYRDPEDFLQNHLAVLQVYEKIEERIRSVDYDIVRENFDSNVILVKSGAGNPGEWAPRNHCLWESPTFIDGYHALSGEAHYAQSQKIKRLFTTVLEIPNARWTHCVEQLRTINTVGSPTIDPAQVYKEINRRHTSEDMPSLRAEFETHPLIYVLSHAKWYPSKECLWTDTTHISDKAAIACHYNGLKGFFKDVLGVKTPDMTMYIQQLSVLISTARPSVAKVKDLIFEINAFTPQIADLQPLASSSLLPVKGVDGTKSLVSRTANFVIADRHEYSRIFFNEVATLDFNMIESHRLQPFLAAMDIQHKLMSRSVKELSSVGDASVTKSTTNDFRQRAKALFRCAAHFAHGNALPEKTLYRTLREMTVYMSDGLSKEVILYINGDVMATSRTQAIFHIVHDESGLRLYMPHDSKARATCRFSDLPSQIAELLNIRCSPGVQAVSDMLNAQSDALESLLERRGILPIQGIEDTEPPTVHAVSEDSTYLTTREAKDVGGTPRIASPAQVSQHNSGLHLPAPHRASIDRKSMNIIARPISGQVSPRRSKSRGSSRPTPSSRTPSSYDPVLTPTLPLRSHSAVGFDPHQYRRLLGGIVDSINGLDFLQQKAPLWKVTNAQGAFDCSTSPDNIFGIRCENQMAHDRRIGAAGELFNIALNQAFETLRERAIERGFEIDNWQSTIRHEASALQRYKDMAPWSGSETADIVFNDVLGAFTMGLCEMNMLPSYCGGATPMYSFEVKTTTSDEKTPFYMSKAQVNKMERMVLRPGELPTEIYVILRVFKLGQEGMGMRMIIDPQARRNNGVLKFEATYAVTRPGT